MEKEDVKTIIEELDGYFDRIEKAKLKISRAVREIQEAFEDVDDVLIDIRMLKEDIRECIETDDKE